MRKKQEGESKIQEKKVKTERNSGEKRERFIFCYRSEYLGSDIFLVEEIKQIINYRTNLSYGYVRKKTNLI